jgi:uncharacterized membrane protein HdeD (DUF308 family)
MLENAARHWWTLTIRGVLAILFAILAFAYPISATLILVILFGAYAFVDGVFALIGASHLSHADENWQPMIIEGVLGIIFGIIAFADPTAVGYALVWIVAAWALLTGIMEIIAAMRLRRMIVNEIWLLVTGILSLIFGVILLVSPTIGFISLAWILGGYAFLFGLLLIGLSLRLRGLADHLPPKNWEG